MTLDKFYAVYDNIEQEIISVHPFQKFAKEHSDLLDEKLLIGTRGKRYIVGKLSDCIDWLKKDIQNAAWMECGIGMGH